MKRGRNPKKPRPDSVGMRHPPCLHCGTKSELVTGREIYPHKRHLWTLPIWQCPECRAYVGCHPDTQNALGYPANAATRKARMLLHNERLDPLWRHVKGRPRPPLRRQEVYAYLSDAMGLPREQTHTAYWTVEQCREAWRALYRLRLALERGDTIDEILARARDDSPVLIDDTDDFSGTGADRAPAPSCPTPG